MTIRAAGAVLWRERAGRLEVAVVHRPRHDDWSLPKGKLDGRETPLDAARREVLEETGHTARVGASLGEVRYEVRRDGVSRPKSVRYWAMEATGDGPAAVAAAGEVDEVRWVEPGEALGLLSYDLDHEVLRRFLTARRTGAGRP